MDYVYHGANILASVFRIPEQSKEQVRALLPKLIANDVPWQPSGKKIVIDTDKNTGQSEEKKEEHVSEEDAAAVPRLTTELRNLDLSKFTPLVSADFEKARPPCILLSLRVRCVNCCC